MQYIDLSSIFVGREQLDDCRPSPDDRQSISPQSVARGILHAHSLRPMFDACANCWRALAAVNRAVPCKLRGAARKHSCGDGSTNASTLSIHEASFAFFSMVVR
jgi:hypothetical protein